MPYDVAKLWSQRDVEQSIQGWGATDYYSVTGTASELADTKNLLLASGLPKIGQSHPAQRDLRCGSLQAGPGLVERIVSARYQWLPNGLQGLPGGASDPLLEPPRISWAPIDRSESLPTDIHGQLITNSAADPVDPPPVFERRSRELRITRYEREYKPEIADYYEGAVNSNDMFAGGRKFPRGTVRILSIIPVEEYTPDATSIKIAYTFEVRTKFKVKPRNLIEAEPFRYWHADVGLRSFFVGGGKSPGDIYIKNADDTTTRIDTPVRLKDGAPYNIADFKVGSDAVAPMTKNDVFTGKSPPKRVTLNDTIYLGWEIYPYLNLLELGL